MIFLQSMASSTPTAICTTPFYSKTTALNIQPLHLIMLVKKGKGCEYHEAYREFPRNRQIICWKLLKNAKIKVAVSVDKQRTLIRIYMEKYNSI